MRLIASVVILLLALTGCVSESAKSIPEKDGASEITLTSVDLSKGEGAKFLPFIGAMSGAFKLSYEGDKPQANLDVEIWKNGKKADSSGSIGDLFLGSGNEASKEIEVIIAIESQGDVNQIKVNVINDSGSSLVTFTVPVDKALQARGLIHSNELRTFTADGPVNVWGMQATSTNQIHTLDLSPESLSKVEWAIIFTLRFDEEAQK
ncbi:hypothetical protein EBB07_22690 [Paenibacillaceae bacterium]|nr:hypothetical protein EBB07_22690 [Paenibacillaceae bacterium]